MSEDTPKKPGSGGEKLSENSENFDPTVQISNAELAAIRQSGSQPSFSRESLAKVNRWRDSDESRQRAPTPQYTHTSIGEPEDANSDPTRSFGRARIDAMLESHRPPATDEGSQTPQEPDARMTDAAFAAAVVAQSLGDSSIESTQESPLSQPAEDGVIQARDAKDALERDAEDAPRPDIEDVLERDDGLSFLDDGIFHEIVFGETQTPADDAAPNEPDLCNAQAHPESSSEAISPEPHPIEQAPAQELSRSEIDIPKTGADEIDNEIPAPADESLDESELDDFAPKKRHPLVILCGVMGMLGVFGAIIGLAMPDAAFAISPLVNALVLAAGALLVYISILLRP